MRAFALLVSICLVSCATADFTPYVGAQQNWPTAPGAFVESRYAVPVFYGPPPRRYEVLGYLNASTAPVRERSTVGFMARRAAELGGDALILLERGRQYVGSVGTVSGGATTYGTAATYGGTTTYSGTTTFTGSTTSIPMFGGKAKAIVIRFI